MCIIERLEVPESLFRIQNIESYSGKTGACESLRIGAHPFRDFEAGFRSRRESEVFGWSRIPNSTRSRSRIFCPTPDVQLDHFLHRTPKLGIPVEMVKFLLKLLLKQIILAVHHDFH